MSSRQEAFAAARAEADEFPNLWGFEGLRAVFDQQLGEAAGFWLLGLPSRITPDAPGIAGLQFITMFETRAELATFINRLSERYPDSEELSAMKVENDAEAARWARDYLLASQGLLTTADADRPGVRAGEFARGLIGSDAAIASRPADPLREAAEDGARRRRALLANLAADEPSLSIEEVQTRLAAWQRDGAANASASLSKMFAIIEARRSAHLSKMSAISEARRSGVDKPEPA